MDVLRFRKLYELTDIPSDWKLVRLTLDWSGQPLLLFTEGRPAQPDFHNAREAWKRWCKTPPKAHHLMYWEAQKLHTVAFDDSQGIPTYHIQRFEGGWLLGEKRNGKATVYDAHGAVRYTLDLGDASEDIQTTSDGNIWVSYFDEGVFGSGIGRQGLVCFDARGNARFKYGDFAEQNGLPMICDCYALNVDQVNAVWLNYYMNFPLVKLNGFKLERVWNEAGSFGSAFAVRDDELIYMHDKHLFLIELDSTNTVKVRAEDEQGNVIDINSERYTDIAARGTSLSSTQAKRYTLAYDLTFL